MKLIRNSFTILLVTVLVAPLYAENYFVCPQGDDNNSGRDNTPAASWRTLEHAFAQLKGGDTLIIEDGNYFVQPLVLETLHGSETDPTVIKAANPWGAKIRLADNPEEGNTFEIKTCSYMEIDGLEVYAEAPNRGTGIEASNGCHHITIRNCYVHDCGCGGISGRGSDYITVEDNVVRGNATRSYWNCSGISFLLARNHDDKPGYHMIIRRNVSFENECRFPFEHGGYDKPTDGNGIILDLFNNAIKDDEGEPGGYRSSTLIENNLSFKNGGRGINVFRSNNVTVRNNTTWHNVHVLSEYDDDKGEIESYEAANLEWYNNLVIQDPGLPTRASNLHQYGDKDIKSENNIFIGETHFWPETPSGIKDDVQSKIKQEYPGLKNPGTDISYQSIQDFKKHFGISSESPAIDAAIDKYPLTDLDGTARPSGENADIGCYEYTELECYQYKAIQLDFELESKGETDKINPFTDYRLEVMFSLGNKSFNVPGYFAADGNAANTGASSGKVWRVKFTPPFPGKWDYTVSFKKGYLLAIDDDPYRGDPVIEHHNKKGSFLVLQVDPAGSFFERRGNLVNGNKHYFHTVDGSPLLLFGTNSPENFLAYDGFDGSYSIDASAQYLKNWEPHVEDWKEGDPLWMDGKGKGIIGALNYLASKEMNVLYALTLNIEGDAKDVWPFISHHKKDFKRYDVSKLAQWDIVFAHAEELGIAIEIILQEQENQLILDDGNLDLERKLYLRELIARFAHHKNIIWNIGEENGGQNSYWPQGQNDQQRFAMIRYLKDHDPYKHPVLMHTYPGHHERDPIVIPLLRFDRFDGLSMQIYDRKDVHSDILHWRNESAKYNRPWIVMMDELGPWHTGTKSDAEDPEHNEVRKDVLWGALMGGAAGVQWYFGWNTPPNDLDAQDLRSRNNIWEQSAHARKFFSSLDYQSMKSCNELINPGNSYCLSDGKKTFVIYLKEGGKPKLDMSMVSGEFSVAWYDPRNGGDLISGTVKQVEGGGRVSLGKAPKDEFKDWVILLQNLAD